jgi:hypothetical protein
MNELAQNIILQGEENRPLPTGVTFRQANKTQNISLNHCCGSALVSLRIRIYCFISIRTQVQGAKPIRILVRLQSHKNLVLHEKYTESAG